MTTTSSGAYSSGRLAFVADLVGGKVFAVDASLIVADVKTDRGRNGHATFALYPCESLRPNLERYARDWSCWREALALQNREQNATCLSF